MVKNIYILLVSLFLVQHVFSQEIEFGKVSKKELLEKYYDKDSSANAAFLYKYRNTYYGANAVSVELVTEIHERIKIYNKEGFDHATIDVTLFKNRSNNERISKIKAYTFNLENDKIVKTKLEKDQIFDSEYSYNYDQVKFTMPNVKEGSVIDIQYKIISPFYFMIDELKLQSDIPIKVIEADIKTPDGYNFSTKTKGNVRFYPKRSKERSPALDMNMEVHSYSLNDVPALKEEIFVDNINNYRAGVLFELISIVTPTINRYYAQSWGDVAKTIGNDDDYKNQLDKTNSFDDILDELIAKNESKMDKMKSIFKYVKDNIHWNGIDGKQFHNGIRKALKEKEGNAADLNLTLVAMLRYAGIDANPLIISTKENLVPIFPTVDRLNYVLAYAVIDDEQYFLDATDEFSDINVLPLKDYNWQGILVDNNKMVWKKVGINEPETGASQYMLNASINEDGVLEGKLMSRFTNHAAYKFRKNFKNQDLDAFLTTKEESLENIEIQNYKAENTDVYEGYVSESYDFYKETGADIINDKIYITPSLFLKSIENPFKLDEREFPIDFGYPIKDQYMINITIPDGYIVESSPEPIMLQLPEKLGEFTFIPKVNTNKIQLSVTFELNKSVMAPETYLYLKEFFNQMILKQKEQIVLTKA